MVSELYLAVRNCIPLLNGDLCTVMKTEMVRWEEKKMLAKCVVEEALTSSIRYLCTDCKSQTEHHLAERKSLVSFIEATS